MARRNALLLALAAAAILSTASLLAGLRSALGRKDRDQPHLDPREAERQRIRAALGEMVGGINLSLWPEQLRPEPDLPDRDTLRRSMPKSTRSSWIDLREDRDAGP